MLVQLTQNTNNFWHASFLNDIPACEQRQIIQSKINHGNNNYIMPTTAYSILQKTVKVTFSQLLSFKWSTPTKND